MSVLCTFYRGDDGGNIRQHHGVDIVDRGRPGDRGDGDCRGGDYRRETVDVAKCSTWAAMASTAMALRLLDEELTVVAATVAIAVRTMTAGLFAGLLPPPAFGTSAAAGRVLAVL